MSTFQLCSVTKKACSHKPQFGPTHPSCNLIHALTMGISTNTSLLKYVRPGKLCSELKKVQNTDRKAFHHPWQGHYKQGLSTLFLYFIFIMESSLNVTGFRASLIHILRNEINESADPKLPAHMYMFCPFAFLLGSS